MITAKIDKPIMSFAFQTIIDLEQDDSSVMSKISAFLITTLPLLQ